MRELDGPRTSDQVDRADWIRERLHAPEQHVVTSIVPEGFDAYLRVLHPAQVPTGDRALVRWTDAARWSGREWHPQVQWHDVALPREKRPTDAPWRGEGPREGSPWVKDVLALVDVLSGATTTPSRCYFGLWNGYASASAPFRPVGTRHVVTPETRVAARLLALPRREYQLFEGPISSVTSFASALGSRGQMPNLWWPEDRAWCVASDIDLLWTYVGAADATIERLVSDERLEVLLASTSDSCLDTVSGWLAELVDRATEDVMATGSATVSLALGTIEVTVSGGVKHGIISTRTTRTDGRSAGGSSSRVGSIDRRVLVRSRIEQTVIALTRTQ